MSLVDTPTLLNLLRSRTTRKFVFTSKFLLACDQDIKSLDLVIHFRASASFLSLLYLPWDFYLRRSVRPISTGREFDRKWECEIMNVSLRVSRIWPSLICSLCLPPSLWLLTTFTWRIAFVFIRSLAVQGLNVVQHDTTPFSTASRIFLAYLPTHLRGLPVIPSFSGPSSTLLLNCPGARLGKNSLTIRFIFSRHGDSFLSLCCTKNRAVVVSRLTLRFF